MSKFKAQMIFLLLITPLLFTNYIGNLLFLVYIYYEHERVTDLLMNKKFSNVIEFISYSIIILVALSYQH